MTHRLHDPSRLTPQRRSRKSLALVAGLGALLVSITPSALSAQPDPIRVLTLDDSRTHSCQGSSMGFTGPFFTAARDAITSPSHFGPSGVVPRSVQLAAAPRLELQALSEADVVLLNLSVGGESIPLDEAEIMLLNSFVLAGGGVIWFSNTAAQHVEDLLGVVPGPMPLSSQYVSVANSSSPLVSGPFGSLAQGTNLRHRYAGSFNLVGRNGRIAIRDGDRGFGVEFTLGDGRIAVFTDEEPFIDLTVRGCAGAAWSADWQTVLLNTLAWTAPPPGFSLAASEVVLSAYGEACANGTAQAPRLAVLGEPFAGGHLRFAVTKGAPGATASLLFGAQQASIPVLGCTLLVGPPLVGLPVSLAPPTASRPGAFVVEFEVPPGLSGVLDAQALVLDGAATTGVTATRGAAIRF